MGFQHEHRVLSSYHSRSFLPFLLPSLFMSLILKSIYEVLHTNYEHPFLEITYYIQAVTKSPAKMVASAHLEFHTSSQLRVMVFKQKEDMQLSTKQKFKLPECSSNFYLGIPS